MKDMLMKYDNEWVLSLLQIIRANGNVYVLRTMQYSIEDIEQAIYELDQMRFVEIIKTPNGIQMQLTTKGLSLYEKLCNHLHKKGIYKYLSINWQQRMFHVMQVNSAYVPTIKNIRKMCREADNSILQAADN